MASAYATNAKRITSFGYELLKHVVSDFGRLLDATRFRLLALYGFAT